MSKYSSGKKNSDFNYAEFANLPTELNKPLVKDIIVYAIKQCFSDSFIKSIELMGWHLKVLDTVDDFLHIDNTDAELLQPKVLLIDEVNLSLLQGSQLSDVRLTDCLTNVNLLCLCQPALTSLSNETGHHLDALEIPYLLLDLPLFRFALDQISQALNKPMIIKPMINSKIVEPITKSAVIDATSLSVENSDKKTLVKRCNKDDSMNASIKKNGNSEARSESETTQLSVNSVDIEENLQGVSILLVEDNLINQLVANELLVSMHAKVTIADNGQAALDILTDEKFDVVLMDIQMPIMDGLTTTKLIRKQSHYKNLPIIAMTAHAREEDKQQSLDAGMNFHMAKPVTGKALLSSIKTVLFQCTNTDH